MDGIGYARFTDDGQVGSGAVIVFGMNIISGATAGVVALRNGTGTGDTIVIQEVGTSDAGASKHYGGNGIIFPSGCFCDIDANVTAVTVWYKDVL